MNSEQISITAISPFIRDFTFAIIRSIQYKKINRGEKITIHSDLVPKFSEKVIKASLMDNEISIPEIQEHPRKLIKKPIVPIGGIQTPTRQPLTPKIPQQTYQQPPRQPPRQLPPIQPYRPPRQIPTQTIQGTISTPTQGYGKIDLLLYDPSISMIECQGPNKPVIIMRVGQRQFTKILLSPQDIDEIMYKISERAHIPLLEGVFKAAVDNFSINAIMSKMVGSKFVIKKNIPMQIPTR